MRWSFQIFRCFGIPVRVHVTLLILLPWFATRLAEPLGVKGSLWGWMAAAGVWASILAHELGHALTARRMGCPTREITLWPMGGVAMLACIPRRPRDEAVMAVMGPVVSVVLAACGLGSAYAIEDAFPDVAALIGLLGAVNLSLAVFNLVPCFPMDGGRIFRAWQTGRVGRLRATARAVRLGRWMALLLALWGLWDQQWLVIVIAFFVWRAGAAEYRQVQRETMQETGGAGGFRFGPFVFQTFTPPSRRPAEPANRPVEVEVGPPPYGRP